MPEPISSAGSSRHKAVGKCANLQFKEKLMGGGVIFPHTEIILLPWLWTEPLTHQHSGIKKVAWRMETFSKTNSLLLAWISKQSFPLSPFTLKNKIHFKKGLKWTFMFFTGQQRYNSFPQNIFHVKYRDPYRLERASIGIHVSRYASYRDPCILILH